MHSLPQLLVSVRDRAEALAAILGGAQIVDIKEPLNGALGRASWDTIAEVLATIRSTSPGIITSVALGEAVDWIGNTASGEIAGVDSARQRIGGDGSQFLVQPHSDSSQLPPFLPHQNPAQPTSMHTECFMKLGPAELVADSIQSAAASACLHVGGPGRPVAHELSTSTDWPVTWEIAMKRAATAMRPREVDSNWIAVAYADYQRAKAPAPLLIVEHAIQQGCRGVLIDTFVKDKSRLLDWLSQDELVQLRQRTTDAGLLLALAGRLDAAQISRLVTVAPDIIGVRGAACDAGLRTQQISTGAVETLRDTICRVFSVNRTS